VLARVCTLRARGALYRRRRICGDGNSSDGDNENPSNARRAALAVATVAAVMEMIRTALKANPPSVAPQASQCFPEA